MKDKEIIAKIKEWLWLDTCNEDESQEVRANSRALLKYIEEREQGD